MKKMLFGLLVVGVLSLGVVTTVSTQGTAIVQVPFSFIAGGKVLPAGTYRLAPDSQDPLVVEITGSDKNGPAAFVTTDVAGTASGMDTALRFKEFQGQRFLWQIAVPGSELRQVALPETTMVQLLAKLNLNTSEHALGASTK